MVRYTQAISVDRLLLETSCSRFFQVKVQHHCSFVLLVMLLILSLFKIDIVNPRNFKHKFCNHFVLHSLEDNRVLISLQRYMMN